MAFRLLTLKPRIFTVPSGSASIHNSLRIIGKREIVGFGYNGEPNYLDRPDFPFPAVRWKETTPDIQALREKEKGDWRKLSIDDKKALYRASFCQTFAEMDGPKGEWKGIIGAVMGLVGLGLWIYYYISAFSYHPLPESFKEEYRSAQLRRMIDLQVNPITGLASKWDYENDCWKK